MRATLLVAVAAALVTRSAHADSADSADNGEIVVVEAYTGARPDEADDRLRPMFEVFQEHGSLLGGALTEALAPQTRAADASTLEQIQNLGITADSAINLSSNAGDEKAFQHAAQRFTEAIAIADGAISLLARDDRKRRIALRAHVGLALTLQRMSEEMAARDRDGARRARARAEQTMENAVRAFPGIDPDPQKQKPGEAWLGGREAWEWWIKVRNRQRTAPTGTLVIDPGDDGAIVFIQEQFSGRGLTTKTDVPPGICRVYTERADTPGRVHTVEVRAGEVTRLLLDWGFESTLHTGDTVWFGFESPAQNDEHRDAYAGRIAAMTHRRYAIVVGLSSRPSGQYAFGLLVDSAGRYRGGVEYMLDDEDPDGTDATLRQLALALLTPGGPRRRAPRGIAPLNTAAVSQPWVSRPALAFAPREEGRSVVGPALAWTGLAATTAAIGVGLYYMAIDEDCISDNSGHPCPRIHATKTEGLIGISSGVALGAMTGYLWARSGPRPPGTLRHGPTPWILGGASVAAIAAGAALVAIDDPTYNVEDDGDIPSLTPTYRHTLLAGGITASIGAVGLAGALWGLLAPDDDAAYVSPIVDVTGDHATLGLAGSF